jgi:hypothetical protein
MNPNPQQSFAPAPEDQEKEMEVCYDAAGRWYKTPEGHWYPSITTVLKLLSEDGIKAWRERVGEEEADRVSQHACERGTAMHDILEHFCLGKPIPEDHEEALRLAKQIIPKLKANCSRALCVETQLWSHSLKTAGRMDLAGIWRGESSIIDFKTAKKPKKEAWVQSYFQQCAYYSVALWQQKRIRTTQVVVIIANDQEMPQVFVKDPKPYLAQFIELRKEFTRRYGTKPNIEAQ